MSKYADGFIAVTNELGEWVWVKDEPEDEVLK